MVRGWNETAGYKDRGVTHVTRSCHQVTMNAFLLGMTPQGLRCWDAMRVIGFLSEQDEVDGERIAVAGLSGGGTLATYLPVLDDRVMYSGTKAFLKSCTESIYLDLVVSQTSNDAQAALQ